MIEAPRPDAQKNDLRGIPKFDKPFESMDSAERKIHIEETIQTRTRPEALAVLLDTTEQKIREFVVAEMPDRLPDFEKCYTTTD